MAAKLVMYVAVGPKIEPTSKALEDPDFTLAHSMNFRRRSGASMRIDAAADDPRVRGSISSALGIAGRVKYRPISRTGASTSNVACLRCV